jgi:hypothetical protein
MNLLSFVFLSGEHDHKKKIRRTREVDFVFISMFLGLISLEEYRGRWFEGRSIGKNLPEWRSRAGWCQLAKFTFCHNDNDMHKLRDPHRQHNRQVYVRDGFYWTRDLQDQI